MQSVARVLVCRRLANAARISTRGNHKTGVAAEKEPDGPSTSTVVSSTKMESIIASSEELPIEKRSLSRGLAMNKFEKDFLIFPEYTDTDDVRSIEGFASALRDSLKVAVDERAQEKARELLPEVATALQSSQTSGCFIPQEFGGVGMSYKDIARIYEELSVDLSISAHCAVTHMATTILLLYGSTEQKDKYLPLIAAGKCRPAICLPAAVGSLSEHAEVHGSAATGTEGILMANGVRAFEARKTNLLFVFAYVTEPDKTKSLRCFIIDRTAVKEGEKFETTRDDTLGLKAFDVGKISLSVKVSDENLLGAFGSEVAAEALSCVRLPIASAAVGYGKRVLADITKFANETASTITPGLSLRSHSHIHRLVANLSLKLYSLESVVYYLAGMLDEKLPIVVDVETALLHRITRAFLRETTTALLEVLGARAIDDREIFEKHIRDVATLMALFDEKDTVEQVAMSTMSTWSATNVKSGGSFNALSRLFGKEKTMADLKDPRLTHFIAEHAHPSLQVACQELEFSMVRLDAVLKKLILDKGKHVSTDYQSLERIVQVLENNLIIVCTIARTSRSYSIGLRNADAEVAWTTWIATEKSRDSLLHLNELADFFGLIRLNLGLLNAGRAVLDWGGYQIENPTERNW